MKLDQMPVLWKTAFLRFHSFVLYNNNPGASTGEGEDSEMERFFFSNNYVDLNFANIELIAYNLDMHTSEIWINLLTKP